MRRTLPEFTSALTKREAAAVLAYLPVHAAILPLVLGLTVVIIPNLDSNKLGSLIWKYKPEHMFGVPSHYQQMAADPKLKNKDLSFIRNYAAGGDAITVGAEQSVNDFLAAHGVEYGLAKGYGMTEVSSAATAASGLANKVGSVGIPLVNTLVSVFEPGTDTELPIGERGELCISGPAIMKGYYGKPAETAAHAGGHDDQTGLVHKLIPSIFPNGSVPL